MGNVISITDLKETERTKLKDATAAFTFSRLPRAQRIAKILFGVLGLSEENNSVTFDSPDDLVKIGAELEPYARKDFAVRYGFLDNGKT